MSNQTVILSQDQAETLLAEWQKILRLQDWDIVIDIKRARDMQLEETQAEVHWTIETKVAIIHLMDPIDYDNEVFLQDHEISLVHELLHLHMAVFNEDVQTPAGIAQEQAIHAISTALVDLKRRGDIHEPG